MPNTAKEFEIEYGKDAAERKREQRADPTGVVMVTVTCKFPIRRKQSMAPVTIRALLTNIEATFHGLEFDRKTIDAGRFRPDESVGPWKGIRND